jgi:hypothetical protein
MSLDNDYEGYEPDENFGASAIQYMRTTAAHEFMHSIQYGLDAFEPHDWIWEASANWMQDEVFDTYNDNIADLSAVMKAPDSCQLAYGGEGRVEDVNHWYGMWIYVRFLSEKYESHFVVRDLWEQFIELDGYAAWDALLSTKSTTLEDHFTQFSIALLTRDFAEGDTYPTVRLEGQLDVGENFGPYNGVGQMGADYIEIHASEIISISLNTSAALDGLLIGIRDGQAEQLWLKDGQASIDASLYQHLYLIVLNLQRANSEAECEMPGYTLDVSAGGQPQSASLPQAAVNFLAPEVEAVVDYELYCENYYCEGDYYYYDEYCDPEIYYCDEEDTSRVPRRSYPSMLAAVFIGVNLMGILKGLRKSNSDEDIS